MGTGVFLSLLLLGVASSNEVGVQHAPGHMEPLGHQRPMEGTVEKVLTGVTPFQFFSRYVETATPVVLSQAINGTVPHSRWTDKYLKSQFGHNEVMVELYKKRNEYPSEATQSLRKFIKSYQKGAMSVNSELPTPMKAEVSMPGCIACGGFLKNVHSVNFLFNSGQTRYSLRVEPFETLRCAVAGRQEYILMGSSHANDISKEWQYQQHYAFGINVDKVDLERYPNVSNVPWYRAVVEEGDCLYLPFHWIHQTSTVGRSFILNLLWVPFEFDMDECAQNHMLTVAPQLVSLANVQLRKFLVVKTLFLEQAHEWDGDVYVKDIHRRMNQVAEAGRDAITEEEVQKMFDILQPGCNGRISLSYLRNNTASDDRVEQLKNYLLKKHLNLMDEEFGLSNFDATDLEKLGVDPYEYGVLNADNEGNDEEYANELLAKKLLRKLEL